MSHITKKMEFLAMRTAQMISAIVFATRTVYEPPHGKTNNLHRRKQRPRSASR